MRWVLSINLTRELFPCWGSHWWQMPMPRDVNRNVARLPALRERPRKVCQVQRVQDHVQASALPGALLGIISIATALGDQYGNALGTASGFPSAARPSRPKRCHILRGYLMECRCGTSWIHRNARINRPRTWRRSTRGSPAKAERQLGELL